MQKKREEPILGVGVVYFSVFFRQCAMAALKDVHNYLSHEEGHVAVKRYPVSSLPLGIFWDRE
jgi:hypothetical protein